MIVGAFPRVRAIAHRPRATARGITAADTLAAPAKTPGQLAYEADCAKWPNYAEGRPRKSWAQLDDLARSSWEANPTPRWGK